MLMVSRFSIISGQPVKTHLFSVNYIDAFIIIIFVWAVYRGFSKGLVIMVSAFVALIIGIWGAMKFSDLVGKWLTDTLNVSTPYLNLVSFTITFIAIIIVINIAAFLLSRLLDAIALGLVNRLLGALFSLLTMGLFISVIFVILNAFDERHEFLPEEQVAKSQLYKPVANFAPSIFPFLRFDNIAREIENLLGNRTFIETSLSRKYYFSHLCRDNLNELLPLKCQRDHKRLIISDCKTGR